MLTKMKAKWDSPEPLIQPEPGHCKSPTFTPASKLWRNLAPVSWSPEARLPHNDPPLHCLHCHPELRIAAAGCSLKPKHNQGMEMIRLVRRRWEEERKTCVENLLLDWDAACWQVGGRLQKKPGFETCSGVRRETEKTFHKGQVFLTPREE